MVKTSAKSSENSQKPSSSGKVRGRPRLGEEAREGLIEAAGAVLAAEGYEKLGARAIAAKAGVAVGTIYKYFGDLDGLVRYANGQTYDDLHGFQSRVVAEAAAAGGDVYAQLMALAQGYLDFVEANWNRWTATLAFNSQQTEPPDWYRAKEFALLEIVVGVLEPLPGLQTRGERYRAAMALWASVHGIITVAMSGGFRTGGAEEAMRQAAIIVEPVVRRYGG